jgi:uncharacterized membrane-anchored protein YhcB (DUF1043 family)
MSVDPLAIMIGWIVGVVIGLMIIRSGREDTFR